MYNSTYLLHDLCYDLSLQDILIETTKKQCINNILNYLQIVGENFEVKKPIINGIFDYNSITADINYIIGRYYYEVPV